MKTLATWTLALISLPPVLVGCGGPAADPAPAPATQDKADPDAGKPEKANDDGSTTREPQGSGTR